jgi:FkbM family methyltransferase
MKFKDSWWWPSHEKHMIGWMADPKNRVILNDRPSYQGKKQIAVLRHCEFRFDSTAVDVGAHIGLWSWNLAHHFKHVEAFEPVPGHRDCFAKNVTRENVTLHAYALGSSEGTVSIATTHGSSGDSQVRPGGEIPMATLDSFDLGPVGLIKVDCEGFEENVLIGGEETIARSKPVICVEQKRDMAARFGLKPQGAVKWLQDRGYRIAEEISGDYIMVPA